MRSILFSAVQRLALASPCRYSFQQRCTLATSLIRLNKRIASQGWCSRREADTFIEQGWVQVNGEKITALGTRVEEDSSITLDPRAQLKVDSAATILMNKPLGIVACQPEGNYTPAIKLLTADRQFHPRRKQREENGKPPSVSPCNWKKLAVAGRLDVNSTGLLLFTQSGALAKRLLTAEKEYLVRVQPIDPKAAFVPYNKTLKTSIDNDYDLTADPLTDDRLEQLKHGIWDSEHEDKPQDLLEAKSVRILNNQQLHFVLQAGKHHHIRRMCRAVGWIVTGLKRVRVGPYRLAGLPVGQWRFKV